MSADGTSAVPYIALSLPLRQFSKTQYCNICLFQSSLLSSYLIFRKALHSWQLSQPSNGFIPSTLSQALLNPFRAIHRPLAICIVNRATKMSGYQPPMDTRVNLLSGVQLSKLVAETATFIKRYKRSLTGRSNSFHSVTGTAVVSYREVVQ